MDRESIEFLIRNLSHEIKNPLTTIKGYLQLSQIKRNDTDFFEKSVPVMISQVERIEKILDVLYPVFSKKKEMLQLYSLRNIFEDVVTELPAEIRTRIRLNIQNLEILTDKKLFNGIIDSIISKFSWNAFPEVVCDIFSQCINGSTIIKIVFSGADFPATENISCFMPYANKTFYPSGIDLYEALWISDLLGIKFVNGDNGGIIIMEIP
jgi:nitrogen fixation/metabolism regulation signal transduction histidine kinase